MADIDLSSDFYFVFLFFNEELDSMLLCLPSLSPSHLLSFSMDFNKWRVIVSEQKIHVLAAILILFDSPVYYTRRIHANNPRWHQLYFSQHSFSGQGSISVKTKPFFKSINKSG